MYFVGADDPRDTAAMAAGNIFHTDVIEATRYRKHAAMEMQKEDEAETGSVASSATSIVLSAAKSFQSCLSRLVPRALRPTVQDPNGFLVGSEASRIQGSTCPLDPLLAGERASTLPQFRKDNSGELHQHDDMSIDSVPAFVCTSPPTPPSAAELYRRIPPRIDKTYQCEPTFEHVLFVLIKHDYLAPNEDELKNEVHDARDVLASMSPEFEAVVTMVPKLMTVDFSSLLEDDEDYATRTEIEKHMVWKMTACLVHYDMCYGLVMRYLGGEYTAEWRNVPAVLQAVSPFVNDDDLAHIARILDAREASPFEMAIYETDQNKEAFINHGNGTSVTKHWPDVYKTLVKEVRNHHLMTFMRWTLRASPYAHHVPQEFIPPKPAVKDQPPKKGRFVWNGTLKWMAALWTMNELTNTAKEAPITFGYAYMAFCIWIWNLRITYPDEDLLLAYIDISSCFRYPRIFSDLVGAFGFMVGPWYFAANAMVFGSTTSATSWEPLRRAIVGVATACFHRPWLKIKHKFYLDNVQWEPETTEDEDVQYVQATACTQNQGILDEDGNEKPTPHHIYVDDDLMADTRPRMRQTLASAIEAIFTVMGVPCTRLRACAIAIDKWSQLVIAHCVILLGLVFNTQTMTVGITDEYRASVSDLLENTWHEKRESFTIKEIELLVGKLGRIAQAYRPIYHLMPQLYASVAYALRENEFYLAATSKKFRKMLKRMKMKASNLDDQREINFALRIVAKMTHAAEETYRMPPTLILEIALITQIIQDLSIRLETPIAHIVPRDATYAAAADACKRCGGGWSTSLRFWWHLEWKDDVQRRARLPNNKKGRLISINALEMACVVINFAAAIYACYVDGICLDAFPLLANDCDNTSACAWINFGCKTSLQGRALGRLFVGLLMNTKLGIQAEWISTKMNVIADEISRLYGVDGEYDYSKLLTDYPVLSNCRQFQPSDTLLTMIWDALLNSGLKDPLTIAKLEPAALGSFISLDS